MFRNDVQICSHDTGRHDISRGGGYSSETIWAHWSHSLSAHNGPSMARVLIVAVGLGNESMPPLPAAIDAVPCLALPVPHWDPHLRELSVGRNTGQAIPPAVTKPREDTFGVPEGRLAPRRSKIRCQAVLCKTQNVA